MITRVHGENYGFCGIRKMHDGLVCEPVLADRRSVARCTTQRLMAESGLQRPGPGRAEHGLWTRHREGNDTSALVHHSYYAEVLVKPRAGGLACVGRDS